MTDHNDDTTNWYDETVKHGHIMDGKRFIPYTDEPWFNEQINAPDNLERLEAEIKQLRAQNAKLEARIEALTKELAESRASYHTTSGKWGEYT